MLPWCDAASPEPERDASQVDDAGTPNQSQPQAPLSADDQIAGSITQFALEELTAAPREARREIWCQVLQRVSAAGVLDGEEEASDAAGRSLPFSDPQVGLSVHSDQVPAATTL